MNYCKQCHIQYGAKRSDSRYCSVACRVTAKRNKSRLSVTDSGSSVTANPQLPVTDVTVSNVTANREPMRVTANVTAGSSTRPIDIRLVDYPSSHLPAKVQGVHVPLDLTTCQHVQQCAASASHNTINIGDSMDASELSQCKGSVVNRVSLPGDVDYHGAATW